VPEEFVSAEVLAPALETVTRMNQRLIRQGKVPHAEKAIAAGVRWREEPPNTPESFDHAGLVMARGWGDCDDLAPYMAASMRESGEDPKASATMFKSGPGRWHAVVRRGDGSERDPSVEAGMGKISGGPFGIGAAVVAPMFAPPCVVGGCARPAVAIRRVVSAKGNVGYDARCDLPYDRSDYALSASQRHKSAVDALCGAILGACVVGQASGNVDESHVRKLLGIVGILEGEDPHKLIATLGRSAVVGAIPFVLTLPSVTGLQALTTERLRTGASVGFNFGKFMKVLGPIASAAVSFVPGIGPIASQAINVTTALASKTMSPDQALRSALNAVSPNPAVSSVLDVAAQIPGLPQIDLQVFPNARFAPVGSPPPDAPGAP
jgi:hypothetical protein